jgi:hypothetical protein
MDDVKQNHFKNIPLSQTFRESVIQSNSYLFAWQLNCPRAYYNIMIIIIIIIIINLAENKQEVVSTYFT